jgi:hypothetical protein
VRQWLSGQLDPGRLFVVAPTLKSDGIRMGKTTRLTCHSSDVGGDVCQRSRHCPMSLPTSPLPSCATYSPHEPTTHTQPVEAPSVSCGDNWPILLLASHHFGCGADRRGPRAGAGAVALACTTAGFSGMGEGKASAQGSRGWRLPLQDRRLTAERRGRLRTPLLGDICDIEVNRSILCTSAELTTWG